jgi:hypothetical protein
MWIPSGSCSSPRSLDRPIKLASPISGLGGSLRVLFGIMDDEVWELMAPPLLDEEDLVDANPPNAPSLCNTKDKSRHHVRK